MTTLPGVSLYNQDRQDDDIFVAAFVARRELLEMLLNILRAQGEGASSEHQILIGARGMGKTTLLRRLAIAIAQDEALNARFLPLRFREEQYNVLGLDVLWRNCADSLAEWCDVNGHEPIAARLDQAVETEAWRDPDAAADGFLDACRRIGLRPVLLLDNLDLILDALSEYQQWALRSVLQRADGPIVIGAATEYLAQSGDRTAAFYEFFHPHPLDPLTADEVFACLRALADLRQEAGAPVRAILARQPARLRTLYTLTGGNPRVLALIYQLLERAESDTVFTDLEALLDQVTPFYKARVEQYQTPQQRAVIDAIALHWDPIPSGALARVTGIEVTTISSHLSRLKKSGFIQEVPTSGARSGYQLAERFLNIWYLMRHGTRKTRQKLRWLTILLTRLYSADDLARLAEDARNEALARTWHPDYRAAVLAAHEEICGLSPEGDSREDAGDVVREILDLFTKVDQHHEVGAQEDAIAILDDVVARFGESDEPFLQGLIAIALVNKGVCLAALGRDEEAIAVYDQVVIQFGESDEPSLKETVAMALVNKGVHLGVLGRTDKAISLCDEVVTQFGESDEPYLKETVAMALVNKGVCLAALGRSDEEIAVYDQMVTRFGESDQPALMKRVARALARKGLILHDRLGDRDGAETAWRRARALDVPFNAGTFFLPWLLLSQGRLDEAEAVRPAADPERLDPVNAILLDAGFALARDNLGTALEHLGQALAAGLDRGARGSVHDLLPFLRLAETRGHGDKLIDWFETSGAADRYAPVHAALVAYVRGERFLLDVNPEVRAPAQDLYERLSAPRRAAEAAAAATRETKTANETRKRSRRRASR